MSSRLAKLKLEEQQLKAAMIQAEIRRARAVLKEVLERIDTLLKELE